MSTVLALLMLNTASAAQETQPPPAHKRPAKKVQKPLVPDPPPAPPPPPPTPEQMPALPPQVKYSRGQLTIVAENSTLGDILRAVRTQTGAVVEIPPNATERVVTHLGPGPAREILAALLNGSHFNYVMMGSTAHPDSVERLILTSKSGGAAPAAAASATPGAQRDNDAQKDDQDAPGADISEQPADEPAENTATGENPQQPSGQQQVKSPEQLLRELQIQQQQQQQEKQQQPGVPPPQGTPN